MDRATCESLPGLALGAEAERSLWMGAEHGDGQDPQALGESHVDLGQARSGVDGCSAHGCGKYHGGLSVWGRLPGLRQGWLDAVRASVLKAGKRVELIIVDGSTDGWGGLDLDRELSWCHTVTVKRARYGVDLTAVDRRKCARELSTMLAAATNDLRRMASGDILWLIEDDLIVPENACSDMLRVMLGQGGARAAVTGMYRVGTAPANTSRPTWDQGGQST